MDNRPVDTGKPGSWLPKPAPIEWCCLVGGLFLTIHYAWLMDDAYVYFRYVDNLLYLGFGLVYNKGEYVEGFSSPLWALILIALRSTGLNYWILIRLTAVVSFTGFWLLCVVLNRRMSPPGVATLNAPLCLIAFSYGPLCYFTSGLETPLVQVAAAVYALFILLPSSRILQLAIALSPLLRHEFAATYILCFAWAWIRLRRFPKLLFLAAAAFCGSWLVFRVYYYADLFPNTFYLKDMVDIPQGLVYLRDTLNTYYVHFWLLAAAIMLGTCLVYRRLRRGKNGIADKPASKSFVAERLVMLLTALTVAAYVVKIGGDPRHYRFLAFSFCLAVCATGGVYENLVGTFGAPKFHRLSLPLGLTIAVFFFCQYPPQLSTHPFFLDALQQTVNKINDAVAHRQRKEISPINWGRGRTIQFVNKYEEFKKENPSLEYRDIVDQSWCFTNYRRFDTRVVHSLGLTDAFLAHTKMQAARPAHKFGLRPLAKQMVLIMKTYDKPPGIGMYRHAVETDRAFPWIKGNLDTIEVIERKVYNKHHFMENLRLAFTFPERIDPDRGKLSGFTLPRNRANRRPKGARITPRGPRRTGKAHR